MTLAELLDLPLHWKNCASPFTDSNFADADLLSLHEAICDLARGTARDPDRYAGLPPAVTDLLEQINYSVLSLVGTMMTRDEEII
jgi:hypothetical protein